MSAYCYFPNNLKDIKDHIYAFISCKIFFPINGSSFQWKPKLIAAPYFLQLFLIGIHGEWNRT